MNDSSPERDATVQEAIALTPNHPSVIAHRRRQDAADHAAHVANLERAELKHLIRELIRRQGLMQATATISDLISTLYAEREL